MLFFQQLWISSNSVLVFHTALICNEPQIVHNLCLNNLRRLGEFWIQIQTVHLCPAAQQGYFGHLMSVVQSIY